MRSLSRTRTCVGRPSGTSGAVPSFRSGFANGGRWGQTAADGDWKHDRYFTSVCAGQGWFLLVNGGAPGRIRTCDTRFRKPMLYPLSYEG
jgi:hypothetical protein